MHPALGIPALFVLGGLLTYTISERRHRARWRRFEWRPVDPRDEHDPFRRGLDETPPVEVLAQRRAPAAIRRTALWSIYMGQMTVPGGLLGLFGLLFGGLGLASIPGMILAIRIWRLAYAMLRREPGAEQEARKLTRFAVVLNVVAVVIGAALWAVGGRDFAPVAWVLFFYGAVSFAHAFALHHCAEVLAEDARLRREYEANLPLPDPHDTCEDRSAEPLFAA